MRVNNVGIKFKIMTIAIVGLLGLGIMSVYMLNSIAKTRASGISKTECNEQIVDTILATHQAGF